MPCSRTAPFVWDESKSRCLPVGVLLRNEEEGVIGGVTGGVRLPLLWRGGVDTFPRDTVLDKVKESFGWIFFFKDSCSRRAASVINLEEGQSWGWELWTTFHQQALGKGKGFFCPQWPNGVSNSVMTSSSAAHKLKEYKLLHQQLYVFKIWAISFLFQ